MLVPYSRIEQSSTDSEEYPCVHRQGEAKAQADEHELSQAQNRICVCCRGDAVGDLCSTESEEEEHDGADEFAGHGNKVAAYSGSLLVLFILLSSRLMVRGGVRAIRPSRTTRSARCREDRTF